MFRPMQLARRIPKTFTFALHLSGVRQCQSGACFLRYWGVGLSETYVARGNDHHMRLGSWLGFAWQLTLRKQWRGSFIAAGIANAAIHIYASRETLHASSQPSDQQQLALPGLVSVVLP